MRTVIMKMLHKIAASRVNELDKEKVRELFKKTNKVDISLESFLAGNTGEILVDNMSYPNIAMLKYGCFIAFGGDSNSEHSRSFIRNINKGACIMPSPSGWLELICKYYSRGIKEIKRYTYTSNELNIEILNKYIDNANNGFRIVKIDRSVANSMAKNKYHKCHFNNYENVEKFIDIAVGYAVITEGEVAGAASSCLVTSDSIEMNVLTLPKYRRLSFATTVCSKLLLDCIENNKKPHWDAANNYSRCLAKKLGYVYKSEYIAYYAL
jgi:hypothetical protein